MDDDEFDFDFESSPEGEPPDFDGDDEEQVTEIDPDELLNDRYQRDNVDENYGEALDDAHKLMECLEPISEP